MLLLALVSPSFAVQYVGNPILDFRVDRPAGDYVSGAVTLTKVRVHACGGGYTDVSVGEALDPVDVQSVAIPAGNHCSLTFYWSTHLDIHGATWTVRYDEATTAVPLSTAIDPVALSPWTVVSGTMSGGGPWLLVDIE